MKKGLFYHQTNSKTCALLASLGMLWVLLFLPSLSSAMTLVNGQPANLESYLNKNKWTVVKVWANECHACRASMPHVNDFAKIANQHNAQVLGLSIDGPEMLKEDQAFVKKYGLIFPNLVASIVEVEALIHKHAPQAPLATPTMMMFAPNGEFTGIIVGSGGVTKQELIRYFEENKAHAA
ncbi:MAG TPA: TlpA family protein disulfide reductase, partial [Thiothrix sp.]|nr:TlpA family protein disulfide reductase [Thiothrix sp.]